MFNYHSLIPWGSFRRRKVGIISGSGSFRGLYRTQIRKSVSKSNNSKLKVDFLSENFKFKLTKCKSHFPNWQFKSHNWHSLTANSQLRKRTSQFSVSTLTTPPPPSPNFFLRRGGGHLRGLYQGGKRPLIVLCAAPLGQRLPSRIMDLPDSVWDKLNDSFVQKDIRDLFELNKVVQITAEIMQTYDLLKFAIPRSNGSNFSSQHNSKCPS